MGKLVASEQLTRTVTPVPWGCNCRARAGPGVSLRLWFPGALGVRPADQQGRGGELPSVQMRWPRTRTRDRDRSSLCWLLSFSASRKPSASAVCWRDGGTNHTPKLTPSQVLPGAAPWERTRGYTGSQWEGLEDSLLFAKVTGSRGFRELDREVQSRGYISNCILILE